MTLIHSFDLDSTLADTRHRRGMISDRASMTDEDWVKYSLAAADDSDGPAAPILNAIIAQQGAEVDESLSDGRGPLYPQIDFIIVSRRDNAAREVSRLWLNKRGWAPKRLIMLKDEFEGSDERNHAKWKANAIRAYERETGDTVVCHYDDWHVVTQHLISVGIPAVTIRGDEEGEYAVGHAQEVLASG